VGIKETGNNHTKYNKWYFGSNKSAMWCGTFALYCADQAGLIGKGKPNKIHRLKVNYVTI
ncbi:MAG: hypothetical protein II073_05450, partial [Lachnospiraceae bacterium]|nr:hypothetical protein [Lachnospiraceae bacterium]